MSSEQPKANILIVDDNPTNLQLLAQMLTRHNYKVRAVNSGARAVEAVLANPPDLVLLDVLMPDLNGYETCERLKARPESRDIPVVFISALDALEDKVRAFTTGGVDYVTKPFQEAEIVARLETHLALQEMRRRLQEQNKHLEEEIAERRRVEAALREANKELQTRNAELDAFGRAVAHDLKNPLSVLTGMADILVTDHPYLLPQDLTAYLQSIARSGRKASQIVEALLLLAGLRQHTLAPEPVDMAAIVAEVMQRLTRLIAEYQAKVELPATWPAALGYAPWLEEVWVNYLSNAIKYSGIPPYLKLGAADTGHGMVQFWVQDNGAGLDQAAQARLFTEFTRLEPDRAEGHGLGLAIVRRIVEKLGGQVGVTSAPGQGSTFSFTLPAPSCDPETPTKA